MRVNVRIRAFGYRIDTLSVTRCSQAWWPSSAGVTGVVDAAGRNANIDSICQSTVFEGIRYGSNHRVLAKWLDDEVAGPCLESFSYTSFLLDR